ncbi:MAG: hypothetical protein EOP09_15350 [Proteobacteria bacterium]|nr:MAG: hypothetical protein EOP09_15350 [Pseudomonadota bacterium]
MKKNWIAASTSTAPKLEIREGSVMIGIHALAVIGCGVGAFLAEENPRIIFLFVAAYLGIRLLLVARKKGLWVWTTGEHIHFQSLLFGEQTVRASEIESVRVIAKAKGGSRVYLKLVRPDPPTKESQIDFPLGYPNKFPGTIKREFDAYLSYYRIRPDLGSS